MIQSVWFDSNFTSLQSHFIFIQKKCLIFHFYSRCIAIMIFHFVRIPKIYVVLSNICWFYARNFLCYFYLFHLNCNKIYYKQNENNLLLAQHESNKRILKMFLFFESFVPFIQFWLKFVTFWHILVSCIKVKMIIELK